MKIKKVADNYSRSAIKLRPLDNRQQSA